MKLSLNHIMRKNTLLINFMTQQKPCFFALKHGLEVKNLENIQNKQTTLTAVRLSNVVYAIVETKPISSFKSKRN